MPTKTSALFRLTIGHDLGRPPWKLSLLQAADLMDAVGYVRICCVHAFESAGVEMSAVHKVRTANLTMSLTLSKARRILTSWARSFPADEATAAAAGTVGLAPVKTFLRSPGTRSRSRR